MQPRSVCVCVRACVRVCGKPLEIIQRLAAGLCTFGSRQVYRTLAQCNTAAPHGSLAPLAGWSERLPDRPRGFQKKNLKKRCVKITAKYLRPCTSLLSHPPSVKIHNSETLLYIVFFPLSHMFSIVQLVKTHFLPCSRLQIRGTACWRGLIDFYWFYLKTQTVTRTIQFCPTKFRCLKASKSIAKHP